MPPPESPEVIEITAEKEQENKQESEDDEIILFSGLNQNPESPKVQSSENQNNFVESSLKLKSAASFPMKKTVWNSLEKSISSDWKWSTWTRNHKITKGLAQEFKLILEKEEQAEKSKIHDKLLNGNPEEAAKKFKDLKETCHHIANAWEKSKTEVEKLKLEKNELLEQKQNFESEANKIEKCFFCETDHKKCEVGDANCRERAQNLVSLAAKKKRADHVLELSMLRQEFRKIELDAQKLLEAEQNKRKSLEGEFEVAKCEKNDCGSQTDLPNPNPSLNENQNIVAIQNRVKELEEALRITKDTNNVLIHQKSELMSVNKKLAKRQKGNQNSGHSDAEFAELEAKLADKVRHRDEAVSQLVQAEERVRFFALEFIKISVKDSN